MPNTDPEARRAWQRDWRAAHPESARNSYLLYTYGLTLAEYDEMLLAQGNGCAICGKTPEENGKRLAVDHDHETGENRGLLCRQCNTGIGLLGDNYEGVRQAMLYLRKWGK